MSTEKGELIHHLHDLLDQERLIVGLLEKGIISFGVYQAWLDTQWSVMLELHNRIIGR